MAGLLGSKKVAGTTASATSGLRAKRSSVSRVDDDGGALLLAASQKSCGGSQAVRPSNRLDDRPSASAELGVRR
jgi:hypothetical protein